MATKTLYFKNATAPSGGAFGSLQDGGTAPSTAQTTTGWTVAKTASSNFALMVFNSTVAASNFGTTDKLATPSAPGGGSAWRTENPLVGTFAATAWTFSIQFQTSVGTAQQGHPNIQVWRCSDPAGISPGPTEIAGEQTGSTISFSAINTTSTSTITWTPSSPFSLDNEYLFIVVEWQITTAGSSNTATVFFEVGSGANIATSDFETLQTDTHFIGKFKPAILTDWCGNYFPQALDLPPPGSDGNVSVIVYDVPLPSLQATRIAYYQQPALDVPAVAVQPETNTHFLARFAPTKLAVWPLLWQRHDYQPPVTETNVHTIGTFAPTKLVVWPFLRQHADFQPPVIETNVHFLATFKNPPTWRFNYNSWDQSQPPAAETQPHFVARYTPALLRRFAFNTWDTGVPQIETNIHSLGRFAPIKLQVLPLLSQQQHWDAQPPVVETNTHFLARFTPVKLQVLSLLSQQQHWDAQPPVFETNVHFTGVFKPTRLTIAASSYYQQGSALDAAVAPVQPETNPHSVAAFKLTKLTVWPFLNSWDQSQPPTQETNPHFVGSFRPVRLVVTPLLRQQAQHLDAQPSVAETNIHTIGRFAPTKLFVSPFLCWHQPGDISASFVAQEPFVANPHFIAKYSPAKFISFAYNSWDIEPPPAETQPHFIGTFRQTPRWRFSYNNWDTGVPQVETNPHYVARFTPARLAWFAFNSWDTGVPQTETNVHFIGRFRPIAYQRFSYNSWDIEPPVVETNTHFIARFQPARLQGFGYNTWDTARQLFTPQEGLEAEPHFVSRYIPARYVNFRFNTPDTQLPPIPEAWAIAAARNLIATAAPRSLMATAAQRTLEATAAPRSLMATASPRSLIATPRGGH